MGELAEVRPRCPKCASPISEVDVLECAGGCVLTAEETDMAYRKYNTILHFARRTDELIKTRSVAPGLDLVIKETSNANPKS